MKAPDDLQAELRVLRDLADETEQALLLPYQPSTRAQLGRIGEVFRRVLGENPPRLVRVRAVAVLYGYDANKFLTTGQLSLRGAGAFITWAFVPHRSGADLDAVPLREGASNAIRWAVTQARSQFLPAEIEADEEKQRQRARERYVRRKREAAPVSTQGQPAPI